MLLCVVEAMRTLVQYDTNWLDAYITHQNQRDPSMPQTALDDHGRAQTRTSIGRRLDDLVDSLYRSVDREEPGAIEFQWDKAGKLAVGTVIRAGFSYLRIPKMWEKAAETAAEEDYGEKIFDLFQRERTRISREQVQSLEQFHHGLTDLVKELVTTLNRRLVIFIDDLDRCLPEQAIGVLEAIKVFLDIQGCVFVLGVDREIIERGIRVRYKEFALAGAAAGVFPVAERDYLEKIVQIPFALPPLAPNTMSAFLCSRLPSVLDTEGDVALVAALMTAGLQRNPRKVKRSFNIFRLHMSLDRAHGRQTAAGLIAKLTVIQTSFADLYERIARDPLVLRQVEQIVRGMPGAGAIGQELRDAVGTSDPRLKEMLFLSPFFDTLSDDALRDLVYQSRVTV